MATVSAAIDLAHERAQYKRCPQCRATASIRGFHGEYHWTCLDCDSIGIGYPTRKAAFADLKRRNGG